MVSTRQVITLVALVCSVASSRAASAGTDSSTGDNAELSAIVKQLFAPDGSSRARLDLGGILLCASPQIRSVEADGKLEFKDYLG